MRSDQAELKVRRWSVVAVVAALVTLAAGAASGAGEHVAPPANEPWRTECGACHVPYPPRLLPARSWRAVMGGLGRHFGADASLEPAVAAEITTFLECNAGRDRGGPTTLRITATPWFQRKHREVPATVWARPAVKSPANCSACHPAAERGGYDDDAVTVPR
jgi:cytochrome c553